MSENRMTFQRKHFIAIFLCFLNLGIKEVYCGMECRTHLIFETCPNVLAPDDEYCCINDDGTFRCCNSVEYVKTYGSTVIVPILSVLAIVIIATGCLCCLCCPCCFLYKRRHNGTVYGRVQPPTTVVTVQQPAPAYPGGVPIVQPVGATMPQPGYPANYPTVAYPNYTSMQGQHQQAPPPPYNIATGNEGYAKQSPYNPNY